MMPALKLLCYLALTFTTLEISSSRSLDTYKIPLDSLKARQDENTLCASNGVLTSVILCGQVFDYLSPWAIVVP